jgi:acyl-CoA synthetase (AMP-forming)/AMP-acid ligase II
MDSPAAAIDELATVPKILSRWARERPDAIAFDIVRAQLAQREGISFQELERGAKKVAAFLCSSVPQRGRVLLLFPPGIDYISAFLGCLYAGVVAVPLYPPRSGASGDRIYSVARSSRPALVLTTDATVTLLRDMPSFVGSDAVDVQSIEAVLAAEHGDFSEIPLAGEDLAFLQYTSGSTGHPKGVMVSHRNLVENEKAIATGFGIRDNDVVLSWLPLYHDMGLVGTMLLPLFLGLKTVLLNTFEFIHDPLSWAIAMAQLSATCSGGPNFAYQLLIDRYDADRLTGVDLGNWRIAFTGAEPIHRTTLDEFTARYARHGFDRRAWYPCYGLAESTLFVSGGSPGAGYRAGVFDRRAVEQRRLVSVAEDPAGLSPAGSSPAGSSPAESVAIVSCGVACAGTSVVIRDEQGAPLPDGTIGEICVQGSSVAQGYWDDPPTTVQTFQARIDGHSGTFLRTGDLGALRDGQLYVVGRSKDLIIVAGRNFYPADLVAVGSRADPGLRRDAGTAFELNRAGPDVVLVLEVQRSAGARLRADPEAVRALGETVRRAVAVECELDPGEVVFVLPGSIPRTTSGKVRTAETKARLLRGQLKVIGRVRAGQPQCLGTEGALAQPPPEAPEQPTAVRTVLAQVVCQRTGRPLAQADCGQPLAALGMDSLMLAALRGTLEQRLGYQVDATLFLGDRSIDEVADAVGVTPRQRSAPVPEPAPKERGSAAAPVPASHGQVQQQFYAELFPDDTANNLPCALRFPIRLDEQRLRAALAAVVARHPALRTTLGPIGSGTQIVHERIEPPWRVLEVTSEDLTEVRRFFAEVSYQRFDLTRGPLVRAAAVLAPDATLLLVACHHAVVDHWSLEILIADLVAAIVAGELAPGPGPDATAAAWARAQQELSATEAATGHLAALAATWHPLRNEVLFPPTPFPHTSDRRRRRNPAGSVDFEIGAAPTQQLSVHSSSRGRTPFVTLAAAYLRALHRSTGRTRVVIGTPHHGRHDWRFATTVGYFVNLLPVLGEFPDGDRIDGLEERTWRELRRALAGATVPFSRLVTALAPARHGQNPLFQATLTVQQSAHGRLNPGFAVLGGSGPQTVHGVQLASLDVPPRDAAFALGLYGARDGERMLFRLVYQQDLVDVAVAHRVCEEFGTSLSELIGSGECDALA